MVWCAGMELQIERKKNYLIALLSGDFNLDQVEGLIARVVRECELEPCMHLLVDARGLSGSISVMDRHQIGLLIVRYNQRRYKIAFVSSVQNILPNRYLETVINNRWIPVLVTSDFQEAETWLSSETQSVGKEKSL
jgi:hypothetical protein